MFYLKFVFLFLFRKSTDKCWQVSSSWNNSENNVMTQRDLELEVCDSL